MLAAGDVADRPPRRRKRAANEQLPEGAKIVALEAEPGRSHCDGKYAYAQVLVTATLADGDRVDVTRMAEASVANDLAEVSATRRRPPQDRRRRPDHVHRGRPVARRAADSQRAKDDLHRQLRPRRDAGDVEDGLQRRHLPRLAQRQERLQALAPRLRSAVRPPRADRRHRRPAHQPRRARSEPDAAQAGGRDSARRRRADAAGRALLRADSLLDRRRREARSRQRRASRRSKSFRRTRSCRCRA